MLTGALIECFQLRNAWFHSTLWISYLAEVTNKNRGSTDDAITSSSLVAVIESYVVIVVVVFVAVVVLVLVLVLDAMETGLTGKNPHSTINVSGGPEMGF